MGGFTYYTMQLTSEPMFQSLCSTINQGVSGVCDEAQNEDVIVKIYSDSTPQIEITEERIWQQTVTYTFDKDTWNIPQYVYLYAHNDKLEEQEPAKTTLVSEIKGDNGFYNDLTTTPVDGYDVTVKVLDNDAIEEETVDPNTNRFTSSLYTNCRDTKLFQYTTDGELDVTKGEWLNDYNCGNGDMGGLPGHSVDYADYSRFNGVVTVSNEDEE